MQIVPNTTNTNTTAKSPLRESTILALLRWTARITSLASLGTIAAFAFGEQGSPSRTDITLLVFFPIGVALGMIIAWWRTLLGGTIATTSLIIFYALMLALRGTLSIGPYFILLSLPGIMFLAHGILMRLRSKQTRDTSRHH
jgi:hypothetical protein